MRGILTSRAWPGSGILKDKFTQAILPTNVTIYGIVYSCMEADATGSHLPCLSFLCAAVAVLNFVLLCLRSCAAPWWSELGFSHAAHLFSCSNYASRIIARSPPTPPLVTVDALSAVSRCEPLVHELLIDARPRVRLGEVNPLNLERFP